MCLCARDLDNRRNSIVGNSVYVQFSSCITFWHSNKLWLNDIIFWVGWCSLIIGRRKKVKLLVLSPLIALLQVVNAHNVQCQKDEVQGVHTIFWKCNYRLQWEWSKLLGFQWNKILCYAVWEGSFLQSTVVHLGRNLIYLNFGRVKSTIQMMNFIFIFH